jgi:hypothetical protein
MKTIERRVDVGPRGQRRNINATNIVAFIIIAAAGLSEVSCDERFIGINFEASSIEAKTQTLRKTSVDYKVVTENCKAASNSCYTH